MVLPARPRVDELIIPGVEQPNVSVALPGLQIAGRSATRRRSACRNLSSIAEVGIDSLCKPQFPERPPPQACRYRAGELRLEEASSIRRPRWLYFMN